MSGILQKGARRFTTQIGAAGVPDAVATTIPLVSTTGLPTDTEIEVIIDRTDGSGVLTPSKEEVVRGTVSGLNLINCIRGVEGTAQAHGAGATVNSFLTASMWNNVIDYIKDTPNRGLIGGVINVSVASNNLTVAVKTLQGTDPSPTNPVGIIIGNQLRSITSALSVTASAGQNWLNAGSAELATREIDYFVYLGYGTVSNRVFIAFSRLPFGRLQSDFNLLSLSNERYIERNEVANNTDNVVNIGRFAATLSAGAGHTWSVPTFDNANLIQEPIYETRYLTYVPTLNGTGGSIGTFTANPYIGQYQINGRKVHNIIKIKCTNVGSWSGNVLTTAPIAANSNFPDELAINGFVAANGSNPVTAGRGGVTLSNGNKYQFLIGVDTSALTWGTFVVNDHIRINGHYYI